MRYGGLRVSGVVAPSAAGLGPALSHTAVRLANEGSRLPRVCKWSDARYVEKVAGMTGDTRRDDEYATKRLLIPL